MYNGANYDRRKYQDASKNYGRRQSDYEQNYNKMRQQRDNEANNHNHINNNNYHQNNNYGNDSYFDMQNKNTPYDNMGYNTSYQYDSNLTQYGAQYDTSHYNVNQYDVSAYDGTQYGHTSYDYNTQYDVNESSYNMNDYNYNGYNQDGLNTYTSQQNTYQQYENDYYDNNYNDLTQFDLNNNDYGRMNYNNRDDSAHNENTYKNNYGQYNNNYGMLNNNKKNQNTQCDITALQTAKSHPVMNIVFRVFIVAFIGVALGEACRTVLSDFWNKHLYSDNLFLLIIRVIGIILVMFVCYILHIILHEFGHLIGGTLSGYSLISFRVFNIILVREGKKMKLKKYSVTETAGECIMMPPEIKKGKYPYLLFRISGIAMNLILSIIAIIFVVAVGPFSKYPWNMWGIIFAAVGIITFIYNGIPVIIEGIPNEGYYLLHMIESKEARLAVHSQLLIYGFLAKGGSYSDVPYEQFCFNSTDEIRNFLVIKVKLLEYKWHLEHLDFVQAAKCLEATNQFFNSLPRTLQYEINSEKMFIEILCENDKDVIDKLYNEDVRKYIEDSQDELTKNRILMAYNAGVKKDTREAHKNYMQLKNSAKAAPIKGEVELQLMLGEYVYDKFNSK